MNDPALRSDEDLVSAVLSGNPVALASIAGRYARGIYDFALRATLDRDQAARITESTFRRVPADISDRPRGVELQTWLYGRALDGVRSPSEARGRQLSDGDADLTRIHGFDQEVARWAWQAARGLSTSDYALLDLNLRRGLSAEEVADAAGLTVSSVYTSLGRPRGAFEEAYRATLLIERGWQTCDDLVAIARDFAAESTASIRRRVAEHGESCPECRATLSGFPRAADVFAALPDVELPEPIVRALTDDSVVPAAGQPSLDEIPTGGVIEDEAPAGAAAGPESLTVAGAALLTAEDESASEDPQPGVVPDDHDSAPQEEAEAAAGDYEDESSPLVGGLRALGEAQKQGQDKELAPRNPPEDGALAVEAPAQGHGDPNLPRVAVFGPPPPRRPVRQEPELVPAAAPVPVTQRFEAADRPSFRVGGSTWQDDERGLIGRLASLAGVFRPDRLIWTYVLLGIATVLAIYIGIAVADSLQGGGGASGAVPLQQTPGATGRYIPCGNEAISLTHGTSTVVTFDEVALAGFGISTLTIEPTSPQATAEGLTASARDKHSLQFQAARQDATAPRQDSYRLHLTWLRDDERASSRCEVNVRVGP
jgi:DNA-directed RNA polymerase specialized sigma24 family protein